MLTIREGLFVDWQDLYRLNRDELGYELEEAAMKSQLKRVLSSGDNKIFVAEDSGEVLGYIHIQAYDTLYFPPMLNILGIAVAAKAQGKKIGTLLSQYAEEWGIDSGCQGVRLNSGSEREEAHKFYEKNGYILRKSQMNYIKMFPKLDEETE